MPVTFARPVQPIDLEVLQKGEIPGVSPRWGGALAEAAIECLEGENHATGVSLELSGACSSEVSVHWQPAGPPEQRQRTWGDPDEATEHGAYALAILLVTELTDYTVLERARKGDGFDYWLSRKNDGPLFQRAARLEASGIRRATRSALTSRASRKQKQIGVSDHMKLPSVVAVVEFGQPRSQLTTR